MTAGFRNSVSIAGFAVALVLMGLLAMKVRANDRALKGYGITKTGLTPAYPDAFACSPLTSLYASWIDVDGKHRGEIHSGVDGGRLREPILAPGPGTVVAAWEADWGWGDEGALLLLHTREELNLKDGPAFYYSAFDHLRFEDTERLSIGQRIARGDVLGQVSRPGGKRKYLPEVHWEVWEVEDPSYIAWSENHRGRPAWENKTADLIDPLYMLARETPPDADLRVMITPFEAEKNYRRFRGFTYILPCSPRD